MELLKKVLKMPHVTGLIHRKGMEKVTIPADFRGELSKKNDEERFENRESGSMSLFRPSWFWRIVLLLELITAAGCTDFLAGRDAEIRDSMLAIKTARDDDQRAKAYSSRGTANSEKARYGRITKSIPNNECDRWFDLAKKDHDQAVALNPASAEVYFNRGQMYYDRGALDLVENKGSSKAWFDVAALDFGKAIELQPSNDLAYDRLGLAYEQGGETDQAIRAYTQEMALNPLGKRRLADAYCYIGFQHQQQKEFAAAAAAYQKSVEFGVADDKTCPYEPYGSMVAIYTTETREYDKAWDAVHQAWKSGRWIAPELILRLTKASGRTN